MLTAIFKELGTDGKWKNVDVSTIYSIGTKIKKDGKIYEVVSVNKSKVNFEEVVTDNE